MENSYDIIRGIFMLLGLVVCFYLFIEEVSTKKRKKKLFFFITFAILYIHLSNQIFQIF